MERSIKYQRASIFRRICSSLFDLIIFVILFVMAQSFVSAPIVRGATDYNTVYEKYEADAIASNIVAKTYASDDSKAYTLNYINTDEQFIKFYNNNTLGHTISEYNKLKQEATVTYNEKEYNLFVLGEDGVTYVENKTETEQKLSATIVQGRYSFYSNLAGKLWSEFYDNNVEFQAIAGKLSAYTYLSWVIAMVLSSLVTFLLFPMIFKDRATLGKKMFRFQVVNTRNGQMASRFQIFARFVFFEVIYVGLVGFLLFYNSFMAFIVFGVAVTASIVTVVLTSKRQTLHDMLAHTTVVNTDFTNRNVSETELIAFTYDDGTPEDATGDNIGPVDVTYAEEPLSSEKETEPDGTKE